MNIQFKKKKKSSQTTVMWLPEGREGGGEIDKG